MAINIPIITEYVGKGVDKAIKEFKQLETVGAKAQFAIKKAAVPAGIAVAALGTFFVKAAKGAEEARIADEKLASVLDTMGFEKAAKRVSAYAESLEKTIAVDADVIKATQTKLATFSALTKTVDKAGGAFDRATAAALDMAAAGFGTAEGNAVQLGKALQDPIKGIAALGKSGVTFTKQEKEKIKALTESGNLLEAQNMILKAVEGQVGGTAAASASSFDKMKFAIAGVSDTFGAMLLPVIDALAPKLAAFTEWASENSTLLGVLTLVFGGLAVAIVAINVAMKIWTATTAAFTVVQGAFNAIMALNPIFLLVIAIVAVGAALVVLQMKFNIFGKVFEAIGKLASKAWDGIKAGLSAIGDLASTIWDGLKSGFGGVVSVIKGYVSTLVGIYKGAFNGIASIWNNTVGKLSFTIPSWVPKIGGAGFSVPRIPELAEGGIVKASAGGTLALIGEGGSDEAVIPLSGRNMPNMGNTFNIYVNGGDPNAIVDALRRYNRSNGPLPVRVA
jgi:hypothetical protein